MTTTLLGTIRDKHSRIPVQGPRHIGIATRVWLATSRNHVNVVPCKAALRLEFHGFNGWRAVSVKHDAHL